MLGVMIEGMRIGVSLAVLALLAGVRCSPEHFIDL